MLFSLTLCVGGAWAADDDSKAPPPSSESTTATPPPPTAADLAALQARIEALEAELQKQREEALMREAEALAGPADAPPPPQSSANPTNAFNPGITAFGDLVGQLGVDSGGVMDGSTVYLRSLELELRADVDPFAKADAVISWEQEAPDLEGGPGEGFSSEPEEAYVDLVALPAHLQARVGKFKPAFGVLNRIHPHDLPWTDVPGALDLLGDEGYNDTGVSLGWTNLLGPIAVTLTAGAFSGDAWDVDGETAVPNGLGRVELFGNFGDVDLSLGASALQALDGGTGVQGADVTFRWRPSSRNSLLLSAEGFRNPWGNAGYASIQVQPSRSVYIGFREDLGEAPAEDGGVYLKHNLFVSYYTSEFLRFRVGGGFEPSTSTADALAQLTFVWGSHPVEPWWVNK